MGSVHSRQYQQFLVRFRLAREQAGFTQAQVAKALGRQQSFVSKCESGERRVDAVELTNFARIYKKPLAFFVRGN